MSETDQQTGKFIGSLTGVTRRGCETRAVEMGCQKPRLLDFKQNFIFFLFGGLENLKNQNFRLTVTAENCCFLI